MFYCLKNGKYLHLNFSIAYHAQFAKKFIRHPSFFAQMAIAFEKSVWRKTNDIEISNEPFAMTTSQCRKETLLWRS